MIDDKDFPVFVKDMNQTSLCSDLDLQDAPTLEPLNIRLSEGIALLAAHIERSEDYLRQPRPAIRTVPVVGDS